MRFFHLSVALLWTATSLFSQVGGALIRGTVSDSSDARVAGSAITLTHVDTTLARRTVSDSEGNYSFVSLPVGRYTLTRGCERIQAVRTKRNPSRSRSASRDQYQVGTGPGGRHRQRDRRDLCPSILRQVP